MLLDLLFIITFLYTLPVIGCANPARVYGTWGWRIGDIVTVTCNTTGEKWRLTCYKGQWTGTPHNCTTPGNEASYYYGHAR